MFYSDVKTLLPLSQAVFLFLRSLFTLLCAACVFEGKVSQDKIFILRWLFVKLQRVFWFFFCFPEAALTQPVGCGSSLTLNCSVQMVVRNRGTNSSAYIQALGLETEPRKKDVIRCCVIIRGGMLLQGHDTALLEQTLFLILLRNFKRNAVK